MPTFDITPVQRLQYQQEVNVAHQKRRSVYRPYVWTKSVVGAEKARFRKRLANARMPQPKPIRGEIPPQETNYEYVEVTPVAYYDRQDMDRLQEEHLTDVDLRTHAAEDSAIGCEKRFDDLITTAALANLPNAQIMDSSYTYGMTKEKALELRANLSKAYIDPNDTVVFVGPTQWNELLLIDQFSRMEWLPPDDMPWAKGKTMRKWLGMMWVEVPDIPVQGSSYSRCLAWCRDSMGYAERQGITMDTGWSLEKQCWQFVFSMSGQAIRLFDDGVFEIRCKL